MVHSGTSGLSGDLSPSLLDIKGTSDTERRKMMLFGYEMKNELSQGEEVKAVAEVKYDDIENAIECVYELWRALVLKGERRGM